MSLKKRFEEKVRMGRDIHFPLTTYSEKGEIVGVFIQAEIGAGGTYYKCSPKMKAAIEKIEAEENGPPNAYSPITRGKHLATLATALGVTKPNKESFKAEDGAMGTSTITGRREALAGIHKTLRAQKQELPRELVQAIEAQKRAPLMAAVARQRASSAGATAAMGA